MTVNLVILITKMTRQTNLNLNFISNTRKVMDLPYTPLDSSPKSKQSGGVYYVYALNVDMWINLCGLLL